MMRVITEYKNKEPIAEVKMEIHDLGEENLNLFTTPQYI